MMDISKSGTCRTVQSRYARSRPKAALECALTSYVSIFAFGISLVDVFAASPQSSDGRLTASGHQNGSIYVFDNATGRMPYSLSGLSGPFPPFIALGNSRIAGLVAPVRAVSFSPGGKLLAAAGDSKVIALYETSSGEQVANLTGHSAWVMSLDWSDSGEYLLSG